MFGTAPNASPSTLFFLLVFIMNASPSQVQKSTPISVGRRLELYSELKSQLGGYGAMARNHNYIFEDLNLHPAIYEGVARDEVHRRMILNAEITHINFNDENGLAYWLDVRLPFFCSRKNQYTSAYRFYKGEYKSAGGKILTFDGEFDLCVMQSLDQLAGCFSSLSGVFPDKKASIGSVDGHRLYMSSVDVKTAFVLTWPEAQEAATA